MATDARSNTKTWIEAHWIASNITKDDGTTLAVTAVLYAFPPYPLSQEFYASSAPVDGLILIGEPNSTPLIGSSPSAYGYEEHVPVYLATIDKTGITATKLKNKMQQEMRRLCKEHPEGSRRFFDFVRPEDQDFGSTKIHIDKFVLNYRRSAT